MAKWFLRFSNRLISVAVGLCLTMAVLYASFALWDNHQIVKLADSSMTGVASDKNLMNAGTDIISTTASPDRQAKDRLAAGDGLAGDGDEADTDVRPGKNAGTPTAEEEPETELGRLFARLQAINPDIGAWITMPGTAIDYAVVRGRNNIEYVSTDIYGNFAIVGSIFLDSRNQADYSDTYNLLYGHNMSEHRMFSDVNLYKEEENFNKNQKGYIYLPTGAHWLQTVSVIVTPASNSWMFNPQSWSEITPEQMFELVQTDALFISEDGMKVLNEKIKAGELPRIVALSTCSNEFTDARTILLTVIDP